MVLRSAILESLQLDKQYYVRPYWSRYNWTNSTTFGHTGVVTIGQTVLRSAILESLQLDSTTFGHTGVVTIGQTVLCSAILESLQLDKQ